MRVLVIVARRYNGHELWVTLGRLQQEGLLFEVVSSTNIIMDEVTFEANSIKRTLADIEPEVEVAAFDGLLIVSGNMQDTEAYWTNRTVLRLVELFNQQEKPIGAICCSVPTVRFAAEGKKVSFFPLVRSRQLLKQAKAILTTVTCTVDGNLVTAEHQMATQMWIAAFIQVLRGEKPELNLHDSGFVPRGRPRKPVPEVEHFLKKTH